MTNLNKLIPLGANAVAPVSPIQQTTASEAAAAERQAIADSGKLLPAVLQDERQAAARRRELQSAIRNVSGYVQNITRELNFSIDEELGKTVVRVIDENTGDVIRQIPSEDMLQLARNIAEVKDRTTKGLLFKGDA